MRSFFIILGLLFAVSDVQSQAIQKEEKQIDQPLTDDLYVDVYTFVGNFLEKITDSLEMPVIQKMYEHEKDMKDKSTDKPHIANMSEGEMAGLLSILFLKDTRYQNITLYRKDGLGVATTGMKDDRLVFKERPIALNLGFLTQKVLSGPGIYRYQHNKKTYEENIIPIYKRSVDNYSVSKLADKPAKGELIGFVSYITGPLDR